jgi:hypothetical protein
MIIAACGKCRVLYRLLTRHQKVVTGIGNQVRSLTIVAFLKDEMKDIHKMRLGVLRELKNVRKFFDHMESSVKTRNPEAIQKAYLFLANLVYHMDKGCLTPTNIALDVELCKEMNKEYLPE